MNKKLYLVIIGLFIISGSYAQLMDSKYLELMDEFKKLKIVFPGEEDAFDGSPYLKNKFELGSIIMYDGDTYDSIPIRYNIYNDQMQFERNGKAMAIENPENIKVVTIGSQSFIYSKYLTGSKSSSGYLEKIIEGDYSLYCRYYIILRSGSEPGAYKAAKNPRFDLQKPEYYLSKRDTDPLRIKTSSDILSGFKNLEETLKKYTGKKKLKLKKEEDYINLLDYLNKGQ